MANMKLKFVIQGIPRAKQSVKFTRSGIAYTPKNKRLAQEYIKLCILQQLPYNFKMLQNGIIILKLLYVFPLLKNIKKADKETIKKGGYILKTTEPDLADNLNKMLFDAMQGIIYYNDSQVCQILRLIKVFGELPRTEIELEEITRDNKHIFLL